MNAETRAKEIVDAENQFCEEHSLFVRGDTLDRLEAAITQALRQAQNEKLEEAARVASDESIHPLADQIAERIRSLIQKD